MAEEFSVERRHSNRIEVFIGELPGLPLAFANKMAGMTRGSFRGSFRIVVFFFLCLSSDPKIFHAGKGLFVFTGFLVVLDGGITIELPVGVIARISFMSAPNLPA